MVEGGKGGRRSEGEGNRVFHLVRKKQWRQKEVREGGEKWQEGHVASRAEEKSYIGKKRLFAGGGGKKQPILKKAEMKPGERRKKTGDRGKLKGTKEKKKEVWIESSFVENVRGKSGGDLSKRAREEEKKVYGGMDRKREKGRKVARRQHGLAMEGLERGRGKTINKVNGGRQKGVWGGKNCQEDEKIKSGRVAGQESENASFRSSFGGKEKKKSGMGAIARVGCEAVNN